jgi:hypothetical protein
VLAAFSFSAKGADGLVLVGVGDDGAGIGERERDHV